MFTPALSSLAEQAPIHQARCFGEGNVAAVAPTSAMIYCGGIDPESGDSRRGAAPRHVVPRADRLSADRVGRGDPRSRAILLFQRELQQPTVDRMQRRTRLKASRNCAGVVRKRGAASAARAVGSASPSASACKHAADTQQIGRDAEDLDVRFLDQRLHRLCSWTRFRAIWYLRRITVRQKHLDGDN